VDKNSTLQQWTQLCDLLKNQLGSAPAITLDSTRAQIRHLYDQCVSTGHILPAPDYDDKVFDDMLDLTKPDEYIRVARQDAMRREKTAWNKAASARQQHKRALAKANRDTLPNLTGDRDIYTPSSHYCQCGCGTTCRKMFVPGHHRRWERYMRQVEKGERTRESLPPDLLGYIKWRKCGKCGGWMPTHDQHNLPMGKFGFACLVPSKRRVPKAHMSPRLRKKVVCPRCGSFQVVASPFVAGPQKVNCKRLYCPNCEFHYNFHRITGEVTELTKEYMASVWPIRRRNAEARLNLSNSTLPGAPEATDCPPTPGSSQGT
jgi:hypothetical protein